MRDEIPQNTPSEQSTETTISNSSAVITEGFNWEEFIKQAGTTGNGAITLNQSEKEEISLKERLSINNAERLYKEDLEKEAPFTPVSLIYEIQEYEKKDFIQPELKGVLRDAHKEISIILNSYPEDMYRTLVDNMTLFGGWRELIKRGFNQTKDIKFGENIRTYIRLRTEELEIRQGNYNMTPIEAAEMRSSIECFRKTSEVINSQINSNK
jgi:hypothetical protein